jgi:hypothetical protein
MKKIPLAFIFSFIALILLSFALGQYWFYIEEKYDDKKTMLEWSFQGYHGENEEKDVYIGYDNKTFDDSKRVPVFEKTFQITIAALVFTIVLTIFLAMATPKKPIYSKLALIVGIIAIIVAFIAPLYFMQELPKAYNEEWEKEQAEKRLGDDERMMWTEEFAGTQTKTVGGDKVIFTWGGSIGWYMAIAAGTMNLLAVIILFFDMRKASKLKRTA